jgi:hypothetical protein
VLDVPEQGARDFPATVKRDGANVVFDVGGLGLNYTAALSADSKTLAGDLKQGGRTIPVTMKHTSNSAAYVLAAKAGPRVEGLDGAWQGAISTPIGDRTVVFRVSSNAQGTTTLADSVDENIKDIPGVAMRDGSTVTFEVPGTSGVFSGQLSADGKSIAGMWDQAGQSFPLTVQKK